ncbi:STAS domain-containing protein [Ruania albidiflava]|uniref:STAS domain-containing protein n=1 Tax=Ruania albidiflava TaxID=366586 RepID=UPI0023F37DAB|nr:STAS domain-containing protein [Ruania albidiflava]
MRLLPGYPPSRLEVSGSVDVSLSGDLAELVREIDVRGGPVDVDASTVTFMDSAVLALLAHLAYRHQVRLFNPPEAVCFLLETTRLVELLEVVHSPAASA